MRTINKLVASLMVAAMFAAAFMISGHNASAADGTVTLTGGTLALTDPGDFVFGAVTLDGLSAQSTTGTFTVGVDDPTASNAGWRLMSTLTPLTDAATHALPAATIAAGADIDPTNTAGATAATNSITYPYTFPAAVATTFYNAAINTGQGSHTYDVTATQSVPKNSFAGDYTATLTVTLISGPA
jgi:hypothetical protein